MGFQVYDEKKAKVWIIDWTGPGGDGSSVVVFNEGNGARVDSIAVYNPDSIDHRFILEWAIDGASGFWGEVTVPAHSGTGSTPVADVTAAFAPVQLGAIVVPYNAAMIMYLGEAIVDSVTVNMTMFGGLF